MSSSSILLSKNELCPHVELKGIESFTELLKVFTLFPDLFPIPRADSDIL